MRNTSPHTNTASGAEGRRGLSSGGYLEALDGTQPCPAWIGTLPRIQIYQAPLGHVVGAAHHLIRSGRDTRLICLLATCMWRQYVTSDLLKLSILGFSTINDDRRASDPNHTVFGTLFPGLGDAGAVTL